MKQTIIAILIFIACAFAGGILNMALVTGGMMAFGLPEGYDQMNPDFTLFETKQFIAPFLAHALGTLLAAYLVTKFGKGKIFYQAMGMGLLFFLGGLSMVLMYPAPTWFSAVDLIVAYFPFAYMGWRLGGSRS